MSKELITRTIKTEIRASENGEEYVIDGRPVVYNSPTDIYGMFEETIMPGALDDADLSDVRFCKNHDTSNVFARLKNGKGTMTLTPDEKGLRMSAGVDVPNNPLAATLYSEVTRGDITGMSFMFTVDAEHWEDENTDYPKRFIDKIGTIIEVSAVTFPAYEDTEINARDKNAVEAAKRIVEEVRNKIGDDKADAFEIELLKAKNKNIII